MRTAGKKSTGKTLRDRLAAVGAAAVLMLIISISVSSVVLAGNNKKEENMYRYYTSIEIEPGDTLWSIASEYCYDMDMSVSDYIREIKKLNRLSTDSITSGQYLTVIYVSSEYR